MREVKSVVACQLSDAHWSVTLLNHKISLPVEMQKVFVNIASLAKTFHSQRQKKKEIFTLSYSLVWKGFIFRRWFPLIKQQIFI